jgi:hypothetical protein
MTSFALAIEPGAQPRLAAAACLFHAAAAASPWLAHCPPALAAGLSALAVAAGWMTLAHVPGGTGRLRAVECRPGRCLARLADGEWQPARLHRGSRAYASLVLLELSLDGGRRTGWLLPRSALAPAAWRRLKALIRLA